MSMTWKNFLANKIVYPEPDISWKLGTTDII